MAVQLRFKKTIIVCNARDQLEFLLKSKIESESHFVDICKKKLRIKKFILSMVKTN